MIPPRRRRTHAVNDISSSERGPTLDPAATPDGQTRTSSCESSVRCVRSQQAGQSQPFSLSVLPLQLPLQLPLPLITRMPVSHLSAAPTHLLAAQQLSGLVSAGFKAPAAAGEPALIGGAVVSRFVLMLHVSGFLSGKNKEEKKKKKRKIPPDWTVLPCWF